VDSSQIILIPIYLLIALIIWRGIRVDAWLKPLIDEYRSPGSLEKKLADLEARLARLENQSPKAP
jgi:hypothetical protein